MCSSCEKLSALLLIEEAEADLLAADVAEGLAPAGASRPLLDHERRARVHFADMEVTTDEAADEAAEIVAELHLLVGAVVLAALFGKGLKPRTPQQVAAALAELGAAQPDDVREAIDDAAGRLQTVLATAYTKSSEEVIREAVRQGAGAVTAPREVPPGAFLPYAAAVAAHPWRRIVGKVQEELAKPSVLAAKLLDPATVERVLDGIKTDGTTDLARQTINTAAGMGRIETAGEMEPAEVWASEIMDRATCAPCSHVDGKDYASMEDAREDYPVAGYVGCLGEDRCRGTLVFVFEDAK